eukprot:1139214-Pelagomonas_calceolata.AAC.4
MGMDPANVDLLANEAGLPGFLAQPMPRSWLVVSAWETGREMHDMMMMPGVVAIVRTNVGFGNAMFRPV